MGRSIDRMSVALGLCVGWGCGPRMAADVVDADPPASAALDTMAPETAFSELERRILRMPLAMEFEVEAEGAVRVSLAGRLQVGPETFLRARGDFAGEPRDLHLWTEGDHLFAGPLDALTLDGPRPPDLERALLLGLTRMGILHNLAMLVGHAPPDHADGGIEDWVRTVDHHRTPPAPATGDALSFELVVAGQPSGHATLWLDAQGLPVRREQVVEFPDGTMTVTERYSVVESGPDAG